MQTCIRCINSCDTSKAMIKEILSVPQYGKTKYPNWNKGRWRGGGRGSACQVVLSIVNQKEPRVRWRKGGVCTKSSTPQPNGPSIRDGHKGEGCRGWGYVKLSKRYLQAIAPLPKAQESSRAIPISERSDLLMRPP